MSNTTTAKSAKLLSDFDIAQALRSGPILRLKSPATFATHPNAPVVINHFTIKNGKRFHNHSPYRVKYVSADNAEWMLRTMNTQSGASRDVCYIVTA